MRLSEDLPGFARLAGEGTRPYAFPGGNHVPTFLLVAQRGHRIHPQGPPRRPGAGDRGHQA